MLVQGDQLQGLDRGEDRVGQEMPELSVEPLLTIFVPQTANYLQ